MAAWGRGGKTARHGREAPCRRRERPWLVPMRGCEGRSAMAGALRALVSAFGDAGHAFPAIALARELAARGHEVTVETWERWRAPVEELGLRFTGAEEYEVFPPPPPGEGAGAAEAARALLPLLDELRPDVVVSDILTLAPSLAAELRGVPRVTLVPHLYPVHDPGMPFFGMGLAATRSRAGRRLWRAGAAGARGGPAPWAARAERDAGAARAATARALPRRDERGAGDRRHPPPARVSARVAAGGDDHGTARLRDPPSGHRAAAGRAIRSSSLRRARPRIRSAT